MKISSIKAITVNQVELTKEDDKSLDSISPTEVLIENRYSHVSAGTELACIAGLEDWFEFSSTLGYTSIGKVLEVGDQVKNVQPGDYVYTFGGHTSHFKIDTTDRWHGICVKVPQGCDLTLASFTHMAGIAITALRRSSIELGDWVAISGMGAIGNLCAQLCQLQGANVIGLDIMESRLEIAEKCGIKHTSNVKTERIEDKIIELTNNTKVSTYIDASGVPAVIESASQHMSQYGELILLGSPRDHYNTNLTAFLQPIHLWSHGSIEVKGALEFIYPTHEVEHLKHSIERNSKIILRLIDKGDLNVKPLVGHIEKPTNASKVYGDIRKYPDKYMGVVFDWNV